MASKYQEAQREKVSKLIADKHPVFYNAEGGRVFLGKERDFVLKQVEKNLFEPMRNAALDYTRQNQISWWGGKNVTGHTLSSQVACFNHLFPIRNDLVAVTAILKKINPDFLRPLIISTDNFYPAYIQFEAVSDHQYLNEDGLTRGTNCTSVDALIYAEHKDGSLWLIPIEWKYTEHYGNDNKANGDRGITRKLRYHHLIEHSAQLRDTNMHWFYFEPFYQLMRQTLWAEQMVANKLKETLKADNYMHLHVIPSANSDLLLKNYNCSKHTMELTWRNSIKDQAKYKIIDPKDLMQPVAALGTYPDLIQYLTARY